MHKRPLAYFPVQVPTLYKTCASMKKSREDKAVEKSGGGGMMRLLEIEIIATRILRKRGCTFLRPLSPSAEVHELRCPFVPSRKLHLCRNDTSIIISLLRLNF
jgi:hypothetical protein